LGYLDMRRTGTALQQGNKKAPDCAAKHVVRSHQQHGASARVPSEELWPGGLHRH
jgi:hypothetical protein